MEELRIDMSEELPKGLVGHDVDEKEQQEPNFKRAKWEDLMKITVGVLLYTL